MAFYVPENFALGISMDSGMEKNLPELMEAAEAFRRKLRDIPETPSQETIL